MIEPGQHLSVFGISGCGKTTLTRLISQCFQRKVIFDRLGEWESGERTISSFQEFVQAYREVFQGSQFTLVFRPPPGTSQDELVHVTNQILQVIYQAEALGSQGIALIFEEVWLYAPTHHTPPWFLETVLTGRHHRISVVGNSQRPASVSRTFTSQCRHVFVGQFCEAIDRKYFRDTLGMEIEPPPRFEFVWHRTGYPLQRVSVGAQNKSA